MKNQRRFYYKDIDLHHSNIDLEINVAVDKKGHPIELIDYDFIPQDESYTICNESYDYGVNDEVIAPWHRTISSNEVDLTIHEKMDNVFKKMETYEEEKSKEDRNNYKALWLLYDTLSEKI